MKIIEEKTIKAPKENDPFLSEQPAGRQKAIKKTCKFCEG